MLLWSKTRSAPRSDAASAALARPSRYAAQAVGIDAVLPVDRHRAGGGDRLGHPASSRWLARPEVPLFNDTLQSPELGCISGRQIVGPQRRPRQWQRARVSGDGRPPPLRPSRPRPEPARAGCPAGCLTEPHLAGRDRQGQAVGEHALRDRQRARRVARRAALQRPGPAGPARRARASNRAAPASVGDPRADPAGGQPQGDPAGVGGRLGAPDDSIQPGDRLPGRHLRGRRRLEPGARVPAPRRPRVGLCDQRHARR